MIHQISYFVAKGHLRPRGQKRPLKGKKKPKSSRSNYNSIRILAIDFLSEIFEMIKKQYLKLGKVRLKTYRRPSQK